MSDIVLFLLLGLGTGAMFAALALGVVVIYRGTGVVNFALGAQAMFPAVVYAELRRSGDLLLPVIVIPDRYSLGDPMGLFPATAIALVFGAALSAVIYLVVFRPLREAPPLTIIVATAGLIIVLQALAVRSFGTRSVRTPSILPRSNIEVFGRLVPVDRLWLSGILLVVAVLLGVLYRSTRFGLATRAAASSEKGAILLGYNMVWLGVVNFMLASLIITAAGILLSTLGGVNPFNYTVFVIPALAAALAGRLQSFVWAAVAGLSIGSFQALTVHFLTEDWVPSFFTLGLESIVPFTVIVAALFLFGRTLPTRGTALDRYRISAPVPSLNPWIWGAMCVGGLLLAIQSDTNVRLGLIQSGWIAVLLLSMVVITGYLGQLSLAQLAFAGLAAYLLAELGQDWGVPFPLSPVLAIVITTVFGSLIAVPALRIRGMQYAIVTFAAALVLEQIVFRNPTFTGDGGIANVEQPELFGVELGILRNGSFPSRTFAVFTVVCVAASAFLVASVRRGGVGRRFLAVRMNERAAAAAGINVVREKLIGAALSALLASVAGVMFAYKSIDLSRQAFAPDEGLQYIALAFLGGIGGVAGALIGAFIAPSGLLIAILPWSHATENVFLAIGIGVLAATRLLPSGLWGFVLQTLRPQPHRKLRVRLRAPGGTSAAHR